jgi:putative endonuclease
MKTYYVYSLASRSRRLYIGVTSDLTKRLAPHKAGVFEGFTKRYHVDRLVFYDSTHDVRTALARERQLKGWVRRRKIALIEQDNPKWRDLGENWMRPARDPSGG